MADRTDTASGPDWDAVRHRRLVAILRGLIVIAALATPIPVVAALAGAPFSGRVVVVSGLILLTGLGYGVALIVSRRGSWGLARTITFVVWTTSPPSFALLYHPESSALGQALTLTAAAVGAAIVQTGMLALSPWTEARRWIAFSAVTFLAALGVVVVVRQLDGATAVTLFTVAALLAVAAAWPTFTIFRDLEAALSASESRRREAVESRSQLVAARDLAEAASKAKSRFLGNVSHELRTPLNAIIGYVELLREEAPNLSLADADGDLERIHHAGSHLLGIIDAILDLTKIEAGEVTMYTRRVSVDRLLNGVVDAVRPSASDAGLEIGVQKVGELGQVVVDDHKLRQILLNLLGNALKYTPEGRVTVTASGDVDRIVIEVADTGVGIDPEDLELVFQPFERTAAPITHRVSGTGLGLAVSRRLANLCGMELTGHSTPGKGSVFALHVPRVPRVRKDSSRQVA